VSVRLGGELREALPNARRKGGRTTRVLVVVTAVRRNPPPMKLTRKISEKK